MLIDLPSSCIQKYFSSFVSMYTLIIAGLQSTAMMSFCLQGWISIHQAELCLSLSLHHYLSASLLASFCPCFFYLIPQRLSPSSSHALSHSLSLSQPLCLVGWPYSTFSFYVLLACCLFGGWLTIRVFLLGFAFAVWNISSTSYVAFTQYVEQSSSLVSTINN